MTEKLREIRVAMSRPPARLRPRCEREVSAHVQYMRDFAARLEGTGEFVSEQAR